MSIVIKKTIVRLSFVSMFIGGPITASYFIGKFICQFFKEFFLDQEWYIRFGLYSMTGITIIGVIIAAIFIISIAVEAANDVLNEA